MNFISVDFLIFLTVLLTVFSGFKRGFFKESCIAIMYVPYMAVLFYIINEWIQGHYSFDSIIYKTSALGAFYIAYLFVVWGLSKVLRFRLESFDSSTILVGKVIAGTISGVRTVYFCLLCLIAFNLHIYNEDNKQIVEMFEKSKFAVAAQPFALKIQDKLLAKGYINNEITIYEDAVNGSFDEFGKYEHPLMKKIKNSERFKQIEETIDKAKIQREVQKYMNTSGF